MRRAALLLMLLLAVGLFAWVSSERRTTPTDNGAGDGSSDNDGYTATDVELTETGDDGLRLFRLQARGVQQSTAEGPVQLREPRLDYDRPDLSRWQLRAQEGTLSPGRDQAEFRGAVEIRASGPAGNALVLKTSQLALDMGKQLATSNEEVTVDWANMQLVMQGAQVDMINSMIKMGAGRGRQRR